MKPIAHASKREQRDQNRVENEEERERKRIRVPYTHERAKTRRRSVGMKEREAGRRDQGGRGDIPGKSDAIRRGRKEEEEGEKRGC